MQAELESGWFAIKIEPDDKDDYGQKNLTKVCLTIFKMNDNRTNFESNLMLSSLELIFACSFKIAYQLSQTVKNEK